MRLNKRRSVVIAAAWSVILVPQVEAQPDVIDVTFEEPALDRWMYPFNATSGVRTTAPVFGTVGEDPTSDFDDRDGVLLLGYDTAAVVPTGLGPERYLVHSLTVIVEHDGSNSTIYDPTLDPWQSFHDEGDPAYVPDADPGRPMELFATGFRNGWDALTFPENGPYSDGSAFGEGIRNAYPIKFDEQCAEVDISNSVRDEFDPEPFAFGIADVEPGQVLPSFAPITFEVDIASSPCFVQYVQQGLAEGFISLSVTSLYDAFFNGSEGSGEYPVLVTRENPLVQAGVASAARLELTVEILPDLPQDINDDGVVNTEDLLILLGAWGQCPQPCPPSCDADITSDCTVDTADLLELLGAWSP